MATFAHSDTEQPRTDNATTLHSPVHPNQHPQQPAGDFGGHPSTANERDPENLQHYGYGYPISTNHQSENPFPNEIAIANPLSNHRNGNLASTTPRSGATQSGPAKRIAKKKKRSKRKQQTAGGRGSSFTEQELQCFLEVLQQHLPVGGDEWEAVTRIHRSRYPGESRTTDSLRRKFALLYRKKVPTGDRRIPPTVLLAKKIRSDMTARVDMGDGRESEADLVLSGDEAVGESDQEDAAESGDDVAAAAEGRSTTPSSTVTAFPIVHKRQHNSNQDEGCDLMEMFRASILQEREFWVAERERAERQREDERERRRNDEKVRAEIREDERQRRSAEREEERKSREAFMKMMMMMMAKGNSSN